MILKDLLKDGKNIIDATKVFDANGKVKEDALELLSEERPLLPEVPFERKKLFSVKENRDRYQTLPKRLPTRNLMPFPVDAHEQIGEYESKHNIYLMLANMYNLLMEKVEILEEEVKNLKSSKD